jgi:hypothetical protein
MTQPRSMDREAFNEIRREEQEEKYHNFSMCQECEYGSGYGRCTCSKERKQFDKSQQKIKTNRRRYIRK